jgi:hypothetical protein
MLVAHAMLAPGSNLSNVPTIPGASSVIHPVSVAVASAAGDTFFGPAGVVEPGSVSVADAEDAETFGRFAHQMMPPTTGMMTSITTSPRRDFRAVGGNDVDGIGTGNFGTWTGGLPSSMRVSAWQYVQTTTMPGGAIGSGALHREQFWAAIAEEPSGAPPRFARISCRRPAKSGKRTAKSERRFIPLTPPTSATNPDPR